MIFKLDENSKDAVLYMLPGELRKNLEMRESICLFSVDGERVPVSVLVAGSTGDMVRIQWLYTLEECRNQGRATELIKAIAEIAAGVPGINAVAASLPASSPAVNAFRKCGFVLPERLDAELEATLADIAGESFWAEKQATDNIVPLSEVPGITLNKFMLEVAAQGNPAMLPNNLKAAEYLRDLSCAFVSGGDMRGILLAESAQDGGIQLAAVHVLDKNADTKQLLHYAGSAALEKYPPETPIHIIAVNEPSIKLAFRLLKRPKVRYICRLILPLGSGEET